MGYTNSKIRAKSCPKSKNDSLNDDNKILKLNRVKAMEAIFTTISADSQNVLGTWIKQNSSHWYLQQPDFQFTSAVAKGSNANCRGKLKVRLLKIPM